jgi:dimethylhistidine N-methyltransferase
MFAEALQDEFAREVRAGLTQAGQKTLPFRYLYDEVGRALFEAITLLPEYGLSRADAGLIEAHGNEVRTLAPGNFIVAELGCGNAGKTRAILERVQMPRGAGYYPIDESATALARYVRDLSPLKGVTPLQMTGLDGVREVTARRGAGQKVLLVSGNTIGNFDPDAAVEFLDSIRQLLSPGDLVLLGTDLVKPAKLLLDAYDDPTGVTAAFNTNILGRINRELEADFDLRRFAHVIRYHEEAQRIEMHLRSRAYQIVSVRKADLIVDFAPEETICTEVYNLYHPEQVERMIQVGGFTLVRQWIEPEWGFAENLLAV